MLNRTTLAATAVLLLLTAGCGEDSDEPTASSSPAASQSADSPEGDTPTSTAPAEPSTPDFQMMDKADLEGALLGVQDMPTGYSQDPPSPTATKTFCDYKVPVKENAYVSRDFTKGGGLSAEIASVGLRQFDSADQASEAFDALTDALSTCHSEDYQGSHLEYTAMSAPKVGDASVGVRIEADDFTLLQNFVLVGPTLVSTGGGGLMNANADQVAELVEAQVKAYQDAATA